MTQFKLLYRGLPRNVAFDNAEKPPWDLISWKVGNACNIPHTAVALMYLDSDGDKIAISSSSELDEYWLSLSDEVWKPGAQHQFIVWNINDGRPDPNAIDPREDYFLRVHAQTTAAVARNSRKRGKNPQNEAEINPAKLRLSGYSTFADASSPLADTATEPENSRNKDELPGLFNTKSQVQDSPPGAKSSGGWGLPGSGQEKISASNNRINQNGTQNAASSPTAGSGTRPRPRGAPSNINTTAKTPALVRSSVTTPTAHKVPSEPRPTGATGATVTARPDLRGQGTPPSASTRNPSGGPAVRSSTLAPPSANATMQIDSMVADRASSNAAPPAVTVTIPKDEKKKNPIARPGRGAGGQQEDEGAYYERIHVSIVSVLGTSPRINPQYLTPFLI
jgi:hypothetical protein